MLEDSSTFKKLPGQEFMRDGLPILQRIINYPGSIIHLFSQQMEFRIIDSPPGKQPAPDVLIALSQLSRDRGIQGIYYVFIDVSGKNQQLWVPGIDDEQEIQSWYIPFSNIDNLDHILAPICRFIFSPGGDWGIFITPEDFLLLGAKKDIGVELRKLVPNIDQSLDRFFEMYKWKRQQLGITWTWIPKLLQHIYGRSIESALEKYGFVE